MCAFFRDLVFGGLGLGLEDAGLGLGLGLKTLVLTTRLVKSLLQCFHLKTLLSFQSMTS